MNERNLRNTALIAEIIGGIAIVVTLIFLVSETLKNTNAIQAQTYQNLTSQLSEFRRDQRASDMPEIFEKFRVDGLESLSAKERFKFFSLVGALWGIYESAYYARERGVLGDDEWTRFFSQICRRISGIDEPIWDRDREMGQSIAPGLTPIFREYVESSCT
jgi:hypothetical protein